MLLVKTWSFCSLREKKGAGALAMHYVITCIPNASLTLVRPIRCAILPCCILRLHSNHLAQDLNLRIWYTKKVKTAANFQVFQYTDLSRVAAGLILAPCAPVAVHTSLLNEVPCSSNGPNLALARGFAAPIKTLFSRTVAQSLTWRTC